MSALQLRDQAIRDIATALRSHGFKRRGRALVRFHPNGNRTVIDFQTSQRSSKECVYIRPSCGVCSVALHAAEWPEMKMFSMGEQIGKLLSSFSEHIDPRSDHWWRIANEEDSHLVFEDIMRLISSAALPWMDEHWEDCNILEYLRSRIAAGLNGPARAIAERQIGLLERIVAWPQSY